MIEEHILDQAIATLFADIEFPREPAGLYDPLRYMIAIGGKRLRPKLCLLTYSLLRDTLEPSVLGPAAGLEVFHTFTLIHDDIMDRSPMRRGCDTVWKKWDEDTAILSGDVMCIDSYRRVAQAPAEALGPVLALFTKTAAEVCEGQQLDMDFEDLPQVPMADYMRMIGLKTGVLIACAAQMGALIGGAGPDVADRLYEYGYQLGLAFQVADDYLDTYGDAAVFGKPIGGDIVLNKKSWLLTRAQEKIRRQEALQNALALPVGSADERVAKIAAVRAIYDALGVGEDARGEVRRLSDLALDAISGLDAGLGLPGTTAFDRLRDFADRLVSRAK
ncbi:MAG: polyprenyl synthetase family protein [Bacteroidales bacterium]|nr:polyprenyl synthetase family protein [Bacteroidales bacterium]